ncbi:DUF5753 domain-containing protein [Streptomyces eurythermus]
MRCAAGSGPNDNGPEPAGCSDKGSAGQAEAGRVDPGGAQLPPRDTEDAVRARMKRQEWLYRPGKQLHLLVWEGALWARVCPPDMLAAQLDRLLGVVGMDTVHLGIVPLDAKLGLNPANGFCVLDERLVVVEDWHAELWLDDAETIALYRRVWDTFAESAVFGAEAQQVIARVRRSIKV